jgi:acetolactate synthase-1/3 small subunit
MQHTISVLVSNKFGVLARVAGLFSGRGFNIDSLSVAETHDPSASRMTIVTRGDDRIIEQITKQLNKLIDVIKVSDFTESPYVERELALIKVQVTKETRAELLGVVDIFRCKVVDVSPKTYTIEATGDSQKLKAIIDILRPLGLRDVVRTGRIAVPRTGSGS